MMHYHLTVELFTAGTMVDPESRHMFLAEVDRDAILHNRVPADINVADLSLSDREAIVQTGVEDAACDYLHARNILSFPLVAAPSTRRAIIRGGVPNLKPDVEKGGVKLWHLAASE
jgi:hypothetical protein